MIELRNITKRFGAVLANDQINIKVEPGRFMPSWVRTARANPPRCASLTDSTQRTRGEILVDGQVQDIDAARRNRARHRHGPSALHAG